MYFISFFIDIFVLGVGIIVLFLLPNLSVLAIKKKKKSIWFYAFPFIYFISGKVVGYNYWTNA